MLAIFKSTTITPEKAAETVAKIEARLSAARAELENARTVYGACVVAVEEAIPDAPAALRRAKDNLDKARAEVDAAESAIVSAKARYADALAKADRASEISKWDAVEKHANERLQAAQDAEKALARLVDAWGRLVGASDRIKADCPSFRNDGDRMTMDSSALLTAGPLAAVLRLHMLKVGFKWAASWPWGPLSVPTLCEKVTEANDYLARMRRDSDQSATG